MKHLSIARKKWNIKHAAFQEKRKKRWKDLKKRGENKTDLDEEVRLYVPKNFDLDFNVKQALLFFAKMRETILAKKKKGYIDFKFCETISAGAGLILAAETERCRILRFRNNRPTLTGNYPKNPIIHKFLGELGFFKMLNIGYKPLSFDSDQESSTQFITMRTARRDRGQELNYVTEVFGTGSVQLNKEAKVSLYEALLEAMNNVTAHA
ncbi:MAG: hypothetical protein OXC63_13645 [Aestuariivita sp.]|nr:hypothetical protein [Aestuariivita sp.]